MLIFPLPPPTACCAGSAATGILQFPKDNRYKAKIRLLDGTMYGLEGEVTFIDSQVQPTTGVIKARAVFPNADGQIMPASMCACL